MIGRGALAAKLLAEEQKNAPTAAAAFGRGALNRGGLGRGAMTRNIAMSGPPATPSAPIRQPNSVGPPKLVSAGGSVGSSGGSGGVVKMDQLNSGMTRVSCAYHFCSFIHLVNYTTCAKKLHQCKTL